jgi:hypothetical protein
MKVLPALVKRSFYMAKQANSNGLDLRQQNIALDSRHMGDVIA